MTMQGGRASSNGAPPPSRQAFIATPPDLQVICPPQSLSPSGCLIADACCRIKHAVQHNSACQKPLQLLSLSGCLSGDRIAA